MARTTKAALQAENDALRAQLHAALRENARLADERDTLHARHANSILGSHFRAELGGEATLRAQAGVPTWLAARRALIANAKALAAEGKTVLIRAGALVVR